MAYGADDIERIRKKGKIASSLASKGPLDRQRARRPPHDVRLGVRYMTLTHSDNLDWADSATDKPRHKGLRNSANRSSPR